MGALPKRKYPKARQGKRRAVHAAHASTLVRCPQCHNVKVAHQVCPVCGTYNGRDVLKLSDKDNKKKAS